MNNSKKSVNHNHLETKQEHGKAAELKDRALNEFLGAVPNGQGQSLYELKKLDKVFEIARSCPPSPKFCGDKASLKLLVQKAIREGEYTEFQLKKTLHFMFNVRYIELLPDALVGEFAEIFFCNCSVAFLSAMSDAISIKIMQKAISHHRLCLLIKALTKNSDPSPYGPDDSPYNLWKLSKNQMICLYEAVCELPNTK